MHWSLGDRPIDGLLELIEERGGSVIGWHEEWGFDALSGWAGRSPILVLNTAVPPDRQRFNAAHELGHLIMEETGDGQDWTSCSRIGSQQRSWFRPRLRAAS